MFCHCAVDPVGWLGWLGSAPALFLPDKGQNPEKCLFSIWRPAKVSLSPPLQAFAQPWLPGLLAIPEDKCLPPSPAKTFHSTRQRKQETHAILMGAKGGGTMCEGKLGHELLENCCLCSLCWIFAGGPPREEGACHHCQTEGPTALGFWNTQDQLFITYSNQRVAAKAPSREVSQTCLLLDKAGCVTVLATFLQYPKCISWGGENVWGGGHFGGGGGTYGWKLRSLVLDGQNRQSPIASDFGSRTQIAALFAFLLYWNV